MYTFLNQKYGLRSLTITWASSIIAAIKAFAPHDFETMQFGKILRGRLSEYHRNNSMVIREWLNCCLKQTLEEKYRPLHKTESYIVNQFNRILSGIQPVEPWILKKVLGKLEVMAIYNGKHPYMMLHQNMIERLLIFKTNS